MTGARDGSGNVVQQFIHPGHADARGAGGSHSDPAGFARLGESRVHGMQYIDELVMVRTKDKGELYYHQDERSEWSQPTIGSR